MGFVDFFERPSTTSPQPAGSKSGRARCLEAIEGEILREKADALRRAGERLEEALAGLNGEKRAVERIEACLRDGANAAEQAAPRQKAPAELAERLAAARQRADAARRNLIIQREAIGLRSHDDVDRYYAFVEGPR
jgi:hypothetical protein